MSEVDKKHPNSNSSDEIDLRELFSAIGNFFKNIFIGIMMLFVHFKNATVRHFKIILVFGIVGGGIGIALNYVLPDYYTGSMLINSKYSNERLMESSVDKLQQLCEEENYRQLAEILDIDTVLAKNLKGFNYETFVAEEEVVELEILKEQLKSKINDEEILTNFVEKLKTERATYKIFVNVFDNKDLVEFQQPLLNYFGGNVYVSKRLEIEKQNLEDKVKNIRGELSKLDSLKRVLINRNDLLTGSGKTGSNNVILTEEKLDPIAIFRESKDQYEELQEVEEDLYLTPSFELIDGFTQFSRPDSPSLIKLGFYSGLVGVGIAYFIILLIGFNKYLNKIEADNRSKRDTTA